MKLLKNPVFIFFLCAVIVISSTLITGKRGLEKKFDRVGETLSSCILDFASENGLPELEAAARGSLARLGSNSPKDYEELILAYTNGAVGFDKEATRSVDQAVKLYRSFIRTADRFPAVLYVKLFDLFE